MRGDVRVQLVDGWQFAFTDSHVIYGPGDVLEVDASTAAAWCRRGWTVPVLDDKSSTEKESAA